MGVRTEAVLRRWALVVFGVTCAFAISAPVLMRGLADLPNNANPKGQGIGSLLYEVAVAAAALLISWYRPRHNVGWWLALAAFLEATCDFFQAYGTRALLVPREHLPLGAAALSFSAPLWIPGVVLPVTCLLLRYPSGVLTGRWARRADRVVLVGMVLLWIGYAGGMNSVSDQVKGHRPPVLLPSWLSLVLLFPTFFCVLGGVAFTLVHTIRRTLRASYPERQQLALVGVIGPVAVFLLLSPWDWSQHLFVILPLGVVIGVFRYRLLGIEVVVRRTLLYGALTGVVLLVFVAATALLSMVVPKGGVPQVLAAAVVAVGVVPLRDRLQRLVDRFVYGDRADPLSALHRLGSPLGGTSDEGMLAEVLAGVAAAVRAPGAELVGSGGATRALVNVVGDDAIAVPLVMGGAGVGVLRLARRAGESELPAADRRLLDGLAPLLGAVLHAVELAEALRIEQERVVAATETERARLRQDLHDGLGPSLTGIGLGLEALESRVGESDLVARLRGETAASLDEVRRIIDGLRPGALESADLLSLLRIRAQQLSATTPLRVTVDAPARLPLLPPAVEPAALRILDEALTNVVRHAGADTCRVTVSLDDALRLEVRDDGRGYGGPRPGGVGIDSMAARAAALGGTCEVSGDESGTRVVVELPLVPADHGAVRAGPRSAGAQQLHDRRGTGRVPA